MAIPDYQTLMLPVLRMAADGEEHKFSLAVEKLADEFELTDEERNELLPSGSQAVFNNRVAWARSYLKQAGLLSSPRRGFFAITGKGRELLSSNPERVDTSVLEQYPEFIESKIILIDGESLSRLMAEHNVGVSTVGLYEVKKLDSDYFDNG